MYLKIAIAITLCNTSVYASQSKESPDTGVHAPSSALLENIIRTDATQLRILEEVESIVKGRHAYNAYLMHIYCKKCKK
jgi:hypothetical protein